jgi:hypothetical protein
MMFHEVAQRLETRLGLGEFPLIRRRLYARLQRLVESKGDGPLQVIAALVQEAEGGKIRNAGQYFCFVVKRRLEEAGWPIGPDPSRIQAAEQSQQLAETVSKVGAPLPEGAL